MLSVGEKSWSRVGAKSVGRHPPYAQQTWTTSVTAYRIWTAILFDRASSSYQIKLRGHPFAVRTSTTGSHMCRWDLVPNGHALLLFAERLLPTSVVWCSCGGRRVCVCVYIYIDMSYIYIYICMCVYLSLSLSLRLCLCVFVCVCVV